MKTSFATALSFSVAASVCAQTGTTTASVPGTAQTSSQDAPYTEVSRDANSSVWERTTYGQGPSRQMVPHVHRYTELATGLNYLVNGAWVESKEEIDILPGGTAQAVQGQHQAYFPGDIYQGQIKLVTPDGQQLKSRPIGLSYFDGQNSVLIAELTNSAGVLFGSNQVVYPNAFTGFKSDLCYTYTKSGFEQDIILREAPPTPESYGLNPATARLQVLTEFFSPPQPTIQSSVLPPQAGLALTDQTLDFGDTEMIRGRAFLMGSNAEGGSVLVSKQWLLMNGRQILVEEVPVDAIVNGLAALPQTAISSSTDKTPHVASRRLILPPRRLVKEDSSTAVMLAKNELPARGFVLDYQTVNGGLTNYTFQNDTTYYLSGLVSIYGTNTFEGGTVIKYADAAGMSSSSPKQINWLADAYRPVIITSKNDNSVGETISGSSGTPTYYAGPALGLTHSTNLISYFRISYAQQAIIVINDGDSFYNGQLVNCQKGVLCWNENLSLRNILFENVQSNFFNVSSANIDVQNSTFNGGLTLTANINWPSKLSYENCVFGNVTNLSLDGSTVAGTNNGFYASPEFGVGAITNAFYPFKTVGAGECYLAIGCSFFNAGSTNIDTSLLTELAQKTTYPPTVYSNINIGADTTLSPQVLRDTDTPDLGYHYDPIDYAFGHVHVDEVMVSIWPGTVIAVFGIDGQGIDLLDADLLCKGLPTNWNRIVAYNTVQEQSMNGWETPSDGMVTIDSASSVDMRFTDFSVVAQDAAHISGNPGAAAIRDCEFHGGTVNFDYSGGVSSTRPVSSSLTLASDPAINNCLFDHVDTILDVEDGSSSFVRNNLFRRGTFDFSPVSGAATVQNNLFDQTSIPDNSAISGPYTGGYNAFITNFDRLQPTSTNDLVLKNEMTYCAGPLGSYYQPPGSSLINAGSTTADGLGLYDYTVQTNLAGGQEIKETNSVVDIGYHYIAVDTNGNPISTYTNGLPDYLITSSTGNIADWWEWENFGSLDVQTNVDFDSDGTNIFTEYQNGVDPNKIAFSFSVASQYVTTNFVASVITVFGGIPSSIAVLVDSTNFPSATWSTYTSSNILINIGTNQGAHDVWVGLRGRLTTSYQTWDETTLVLNSAPPSITITNPANSTSLNSSRVNIRGNFTSGALSQITVNGVNAFVSGTNFDALNVPLAAGTNVITAIIEDFTGLTNVASIQLIGTTNSDGSMNDPIQLQATPVAGFAPLQVTFSIQTNLPGTIQQVLYDFNGDDVIDLATNNLSSLTYTYDTNGEYFPVVTIQTSAGRFSSTGGWSTADPNRLQINVQAELTESVFANVTDPIDLKWRGTNLYVLSGSGATITEFDTNAASVRSLSGLGTNPSGFDVDSAGSVYIAITSSNQVWKFIPTNNSFIADTNFGVGGRIGLTNGSSGTDNGVFNAPFSVAVSPDGAMISVSDSGNNRIQQFSAADGTFSATFGTIGTGVGQFNAPNGLSYDSSGKLYIIDSGNNRVIVVHGTDILGVSGTAGTGFLEFNNPEKINVNERGVYIADTGNNRVQCFSPLGNGVYSFVQTDMRFAISTNLNQPTAVAGADNLTDETFYVSDSGNNRIVLFSESTNAAAAIFSVWNSMTTRIAASDITGAVSCFSAASADAYQQAFLSIGTANTISAINQIGTLTPVYILGNQAEYYFTNTIEGQFITFPVDFNDENGVWKITQF